MRSVRRYRRAGAWLALISIVGLALGPTVSRLILADRCAFAQPSVTTAWASCPHGTLKTALQGTDRSPHRHHHHGTASGSGSTPATPNVPAHDHAFEPCGLCLVAAHAFTFTLEQPALVAVRGRERPVAETFAGRVPRLRSDWSPASSRGPPSRA